MKILITWVVVIGLFAPAFSVLTKPDECGSDVGCYTDCDGGECKFVVTWMDNGNGGVNFRLSLDLGSNSQDQYIALGLSSDTEMGGDSVTECVMGHDGVQVYKSYNPGKYNQRLTEPKQGISGEAVSDADGVLTCTYTQTVTSSNDQIFNLNTNWVFLVANGVYSNGALLQHSVDVLPARSASSIDLQSTADVSGEAVNTLVKVHGCLMMFAWIFCASIGIVLARHYKPMWPNSRPCGEKVWFANHRALMLTTFAACVAGFIVIFVDVEGWAELPGAGRWQKVHPILGVIVTFLVIVNPLMALIRPHPETPYRFIYNWAHWFVGVAAHIISVLAMIIGVTMAKAQTPFYVVWILLTFAVYQFIAELGLEVFDCFVAGDGKKYYRDGSMKEPRGSTFKKVALFCHVIIITGFAAACIVIVAISNE